jgi:hypothetical protein
MSAGSRCSALVLPNALCVSLCAWRQSVQRQPVCQPAEVPCRALVTARTLAAADRSQGQTTSQDRVRPSSDNRSLPANNPSPVHTPWKVSFLETNVGAS